MESTVLGPEEFHYICGLVYEKCGVVLGPGKEYLVETRLLPLAREQGLPGVQELVAHLRFHPEGALCRRVAEALATHETSFFRDGRPFEVLRDWVLPELIRRRTRERRLSIWCAACASGQEVYSLAMLLRDHFPGLEGWNIRILASDFSRTMLDQAREGTYTDLQMRRGLSQIQRARHFRVKGDRWEVHEDIRGMIEFRELNLTTSWPPLARMDIVLLRNVLLYFDAASRRRVLNETADLLREDGHLFLGSTESILATDEPVRWHGAGCPGHYRLVTGKETELAGSGGNLIKTPV